MHPWRTIVSRPRLAIVRDFLRPGARSFHRGSSLELQQVTTLTDWHLEHFRQHAFIPQIPVSLPFMQDSLPEACVKWFIHEDNISHRLAKQPKSSELKASFWSNHKAVMVPLELTSTTGGSTDKAEDVGQNVSFHRHEAPLDLLLRHLGKPQGPKNSQSPLKHGVTHSMYLAQCDLSTLPEPMQAQLPTPELVKLAGKGDVYASSLWLGRPPTYTPLHRDPNPNLLVQLAGRKVIRLFAPDIGTAIFDDVQERLALYRVGQRKASISASFRGEEMMQGPERSLLHSVVWGSDKNPHDYGVEKRAEAISTGYLEYGLEKEIGMGEALFIPRGWWHSVRGVGEGVTASANWWFR